MRIAVNARFLLKDRLEGLGRFSHEVLQRLVKDHPEHQFIFFFDRPYSEEFVYADNVIPVSVFPPARHPYLYYLWFEWSLPRQFKKWKPDLFFSPDGFLSLKAEIPQVPVIHDLAFEHYPEYVSKTGAAYYRKYFPQFAKKAIRIATVSSYSKEDIQKTYGIKPELIDVVYNGASEGFHPLSDEKLANFRKEKMQNHPWFVYVGSLHPRKNIHRLLKAFDQFKVEDSENYQLVIVGRKAWQTEELEEVYSNMTYKDSVIFTGRISDEEMLPYLCGARALSYIPIFEGFGLPLLEAFQCGTPAITSNGSSLPEVAGDAAICVDPMSARDIAQAMLQIAKDDSLHERLKKNALKRAQAFSWGSTAERVWQCLEKSIFDRA